MKEEATRKTLKAQVVFQAPDVCLTPSGPSMVPVPYPIIGQFSDSTATTPTVKMTSEEAFNLGSKIATVIGDEAGVGGGVMSGVNKNVCEYLTFSPTVFAEGKNVVRHDDIMWMNNRNTIGKVLFPIGLLANVSAPSPEAFNPPVIPTPKEKGWLEKIGDKFEELDSEYKLVNRGVGVLQVVGGVSEMLVGAELLVASGAAEAFSGGVATPIAIPTAIVGGVAAVHGADSTSAGLQTLWTGQIQQTNTEKGAAWAAEKVGASPENAKAIGSGIDLAVGLLGPGTQLAKGLGKWAAKRAALKEAEKLALLKEAEKKALEAAAKGSGAGGTAVTKALPAPLKWTGKIVDYKKGAMSPIEHIFYRHGPNSGFSNVGKFSPGTGVRDVKAMVEEARQMGKWTFQPNGRGGIVHDFGRPIGTTKSGAPATKIQIHFNEAGEIQTAFPLG
jgi:hypothetical protein